MLPNTEEQTLGTQEPFEVRDAKQSWEPVRAFDLYKEPALKKLPYDEVVQVLNGRIEENWNKLPKYPIGDAGFEITRSGDKNEYLTVAKENWEATLAFWNDLSIFKASEGVNVPELTKLFDTFYQLSSYSKQDDDETGFGVAWKYFYNELFVPTILAVKDKAENAASVPNVMHVLLEYASNHYDASYEDTTIASDVLNVMLNLDAKRAFEVLPKYLNNICTIAAKIDDETELVEPPSTEFSRPIKYYADNGQVTHIDYPKYTEKDRERWSALADAYTYSEINLMYDELNGIRKLHSTICDYVTSVEWDAKSKANIVTTLSKTLSYRSQGSLNSYVYAFEHLGADVSYPFLLENLKSPDTLTRRFSAEVLYKLEMGKIGITSEQGVQYFDKIYQLIKETDPDFFVNLYGDTGAYVFRVDNNGSIGVFNSENKLLGYFKLDLESSDTVVQAPICEVLSKDVFLAKADETPEERHIRESFLQLYLTGYSSLYEQINIATGIKLNSLDLHEQGWFIAYYSQATPEQKKRLIDLVKLEGELGLKVFLALDYGESGDEILNFEENIDVPREYKQALFAEFYRIATSAKELRSVFEQLDTPDYSVSSDIHEALVRKCAEYFRAALMIEKGLGGDISRHELLENMKAVSFALDTLKGLYGQNSSLKLTKREAPISEYINAGGNSVLKENARFAWTLEDSMNGASVNINIRPEAAAAHGRQPRGEARINFKVFDPKTNMTVRIGVDKSDYYVLTQPDGQPVLSLDLGTLSGKENTGARATESVGRILSMVEKSQGGHNERSFSQKGVVQFRPIAKRFEEYLENRYES
jgi:hypothetical protein